MLTLPSIHEGFGLLDILEGETHALRNDPRLLVGLRWIHECS